LEKCQRPQIWIRVSLDDKRQDRSGNDQETGRQVVRYFGARDKTNHLLRGHTNSLDAKLAPAEVEEVFQVRTQEVDDKNIMEALLSKMVDLGNAGCAESRGRSMREHWAGREKRENGRATYKCRSRFGMIDTHLEVGGLQTSEVPIHPGKSVCWSFRGIAGCQPGTENH